MNKDNIVLFLGAGFSKSIQSSLPLGAKLLERILAEIDEVTRRTINQLPPDALSPCSETENENSSVIQPFELLLAILQRLRSQQLSGRPKLSGVEADRLWRILVDRVAHVTRFQHPGYQNYANPETESGQFISFVRDISREVSVSIVTTNYDLIADKASAFVTDEILGYSHSAGPPKDLRRFQYGYPIRGVWTQSATEVSVLDEEYEPWSFVSGVPVYKLHGSTNWAYCDTCKQLDLSATKREVGAVFDSKTQSAMCQYCGSPFDWLIIPPVPNKNVVGHPVLERVWRSAEQALETAHRVIFIGYSFPPADPVVLELVSTARLRSRQAHGKPWEYWLFDPDKSVCCRYRSIFGGKGPLEPRSFSMKLLWDSWRSTR